MRTRIEIIAKEQLSLDPNQPIVVGVSGGPDSLCLGHVLASLGYACTWAYFDHRLRPESAQDGDAVEQMAGAAGAAWVRGQGDVTAYARQAGLSVEEAARSLRYQFLFQQAEKLRAQALAVAHNANDQVETSLMHLLRGAGLDGLSGMSLSLLPNPWSTDIPLIRPLLSTWRSEIEAYLHAHKLEPLQDPTNQDTHFFRNRLRHELIPALETYNPNIQASLWRMTNLLQDDREVLEAAAALAWPRCVTWNEDGLVALDQAELLAQPVGVQRRLLRLAIQQLRPGLRDIDFGFVQRALDFAAEPSASRTCDLAAGLRLVWEDGTIWLSSWDAELPNLGWPEVDSQNPLRMSVPGRLNVGRGWFLQAEVVKGQPGELYTRARANTAVSQAWFDSAALPRPLEIRARRPGDRFQPLGMEGRSMKLSDFFTNMKMPPRVRDVWPLVTAGDTIIWVAGYRQGEAFQVGPETVQAVRLQLIQ